MLNKRYYLNNTINNLKKVSRTVNGKIDTSASKNKNKLFKKSKNLKERALSNFKKTILWLYENKDKKFKNIKETKNFVEKIAKNINKSILKDKILYRKEDSSKFDYTKIKDLPLKIDKFYKTFFEKVNNTENPKEIAAWTIYCIDLKDHFFADGCGKTALALSTWILMRKRQPLPNYTTREDYYAHAQKNPLSNKKLVKASLEDWTKYYLSLF